MTESNATFGQVLMVLREWADAIRGDWGSIDGRSVRADMNLMADTLLAANHDSGSQVTVRALRQTMGVCAVGGGHWEWYCNDGRDCAAQAAERRQGRAA